MFSLQQTLSHFSAVAQAHTEEFPALLSPVCASGVSDYASTDLLRVATTILGVALTMILCALIKRELRRYLRKMGA